MKRSSFNLNKNNGFLSENHLNNRSAEAEDSFRRCWTVEELKGKEFKRIQNYVKGGDISPPIGDISPGPLFPRQPCIDSCFPYLRAAIYRPL